MTTLLVLGSKPAPMLPDRGSIDALACANASGYYAAELGLPTPILTCLSAVLASGKDSDEHSLKRLAGLRTERAYYLPRPKLEAAQGWRRLKLAWKMRHLRPAALRQRLDQLGYQYAQFLVQPAGFYHSQCLKHAGDCPDLVDTLARKQPSTGLVTIALALDETGFDKVVVAGFDFTLNHAYGANPLIAERGHARSEHAVTDVALLRAMGRHHPRLVTTEPTVAERCGLPLVSAEAQC